MLPAFENHDCCFCGADFGRWGHNPEPLMDGTTKACCDTCNFTKVIPARLYGMMMKDDGINSFEFNITDDFEEIEFEEDQKALLPMPSGLTKVRLCINWWDHKYKEVDFTGTTCEEAVKKILAFYANKAYRRGVGDHTFFEGFDDGVIHLGS